MKRLFSCFFFSSRSCRVLKNEMTEEVCSFVFVEELSDGGDVDAVGYEGAFESEAALCAEIALEVGAVHALALLAVFHAEIKSVGRLGHVHRHRQPNQQRHDGHGRHFLSALSRHPAAVLLVLGRTRPPAYGAIHFDSNGFFRLFKLGEICRDKNGGRDRLSIFSGQKTRQIGMVVVMAIWFNLRDPLFFLPLRRTGQIYYVLL
jgi:hypothetical protein